MPPTQREKEEMGRSSIPAASRRELKHTTKKTGGREAQWSPGSGDTHPDFPEHAAIDLKDVDTILLISEDFKEKLEMLKSQNWEMAIKKHAKVLRYVDSSKAVTEKADLSRLQPIEP